MGKIEIVQGLRALAVLLVVWTHSIVAAAYHSDPKQATFFHLKSFGACGLDIFFVISGFIVSLVASRAVAQNQPSARTFLSRRFTRIFPLYWILTGVVILEAQLRQVSHPVAPGTVAADAVSTAGMALSCASADFVARLESCLRNLFLFGSGGMDALRAAASDPQHDAISGRHGRAGSCRRDPSTRVGDLVESCGAGVFVRVCDRAGGDEDGRDGFQQSHWDSAALCAKGANARAVAGRC